MDFGKKIVDLLSKETGLEKKLVEKIFTIPPKGLGDFAFPCFVLAKKLKKNPNDISKELVQKIGSKKIVFLEKIVAEGPYINFFVSKKTLSEETLKKVFEKKSTKTKKEKILLEYSSPNTNKPLHIGHLRNNTLGMAFSNLLMEKGHKVIRSNLVNDRGVHICKSMLAYKLFGKNRDPKKEGIKPDHFVGEMYVLFEKMNKEKPELKLEEKAQEMLVSWEKNDEETILLWKKMNKWALDGMLETYDNFGTKFDSFFYESNIFRESGKQREKLLKKGFEKNVFRREDNGAVTAVLEPELPNKVIVRGDGTSL